MPSHLRVSFSQPNSHSSFAFAIIEGNIINMQDALQAQTLQNRVPALIIMIKVSLPCTKKDSKQGIRISRFQLSGIKINFLKN